jgi:tetratricopeptide (TPR) repeat protein
LWTGSASADAASDAATPGGSAPAAPAPASDPVKDAGERYQRGLTLYADGEFLLALVEFERAYELSPNYRVLYNIGQVRIQLGRYAKGREALEAYLAQGGTEIPAERSAAVNKDLAMLAERTADLQLTSNEAGADISLDGHLVGSSPLSAPLVVDAGEHTLQIHKAGFYDLSRSVTLAGRDHIALDLHLSKLPENAPRVVVERHTERVVTTKPARTSMWVGWAATGTLAVTAGVIGYLGVSKANELESIRTDYGVTRSKLDDTKSSARTLLVISDLTAGAAAVVGGVSLYLTLSSPSAERAPGQRASSQRGPVAVAISPRGLRLVTSF